MCRVVDRVQISRTLLLMQPRNARRPAIRASAAKALLSADMRLPVRAAWRPHGVATHTPPKKAPDVAGASGDGQESMGWYGKVLGALIGAMVGRGWIGAVIGLLIGHMYDRRVAAGQLGGADPQALSAAILSRDLPDHGAGRKVGWSGSPSREIEAARAA